MTNPQQIIEATFAESVAVKQRSLDALVGSLTDCAARLTEVLLAGRKLLILGNGGSAGDAQHFAAELVGRFERERRAIPAMALTTDTSALTAIGNDYGFDQVYARQIAALGAPADVLVAITTSGNSANVLRAIDAAHTAGLRILLLTGNDGGKARALLRDGDQALCVPSSRTARIQEVHILLIHCLCDLIEREFAKETD